MKLSNLRTRLLSALVLIPLVVVAARYEWIFGVLVLAAFVLSCREWIAMVLKIYPGGAGRTAGILSGLFYLGFSVAALITLRFCIESGPEFTLYLMFLVWASDSAAYLFGKTFGGPKMSPTISPNKTWAGYLGAFLGSALVLQLCIHVLTPSALIEKTPDPLLTFGAGVLLGVTGQSGDLLISAMKRRAGVKDSGDLIPGHGGILDRIDSLLLVVFPYFAFVVLILRS